MGKAKVMEPEPSAPVWEEILKHSKAEGVQKLKHAPLSEYWPKIAMPGTVVEVENAAFPQVQELNPGNLDVLNGYWYCEVKQWAGYYAQLEFLGYPKDQDADVEKLRSWIHLNDLHPINYFSEKKRVRAVPPIPVGPNCSDNNVVTALFRSMIGKLSLSALCSDWIKNSLSPNWSVGNRVEVQDKECISHMKAGYVTKLVGRRVMVRYWNSHKVKSEDYWVHADSPLICRPGWSQEIGLPISCSSGSSNPQGIRTDLPKEPPAGVVIELGMRFEMINPIKTEEIAVGEVTEVLKHGYFKCEIVSPFSGDDLKTYAKGINQFYYHFGSDQIFPIGTASKYKVQQSTSWSYTKTMVEPKLPLPEKIGIIENQLELGSVVEAVDGYVPELVCPARIQALLGPYAAKIRFIGWPSAYDQWKPLNSLDIFPVGWCELVGHALADVGTEVDIQVVVKEVEEEKPEQRERHVKQLFTPPPEEPSTSSAASLESKAEKKPRRNRKSTPKKVIQEIEPPVKDPVKSRGRPKKEKASPKKKEAAPKRPSQKRKKSMTIASSSEDEAEGPPVLLPMDSPTTAPKIRVTIKKEKEEEEEEEAEPRILTSPGTSSTRRSGRSRAAPTFFGDNVNRRNPRHFNLE